MGQNSDIISYVAQSGSDGNMAISVMGVSKLTNQIFPSLCCMLEL